MRICKEKSFHQRQGSFEILNTLSHGTTGAACNGQDAIDRWWWRR